MHGKLPKVRTGVGEQNHEAAGDAHGHHRQGHPSGPVRLRVDQPHAEQGEHAEHPDDRPSRRWGAGGGNPQPRLAGIRGLAKHVSQFRKVTALRQLVDGTAEVA